MTLATLVIVVPIVLGALTATLRAVLPPVGAFVLALGGAIWVVVGCALLLGRPTEVLWLGGWRPAHGIPIGIALIPDPAGVGMALFTAVLVVAAIIAAERLADTTDPLFATLTLVLTGAITAFCLAGDLFTIFVCFELMSVCAYALVALRNRDRSALQGALHFAVVNSIGAMLMLFGIALLYGRTGALNLARIGQVLAAQGPPDTLVVIAFVLVATGMLVKAAAVPFHFWLADAYAAASAPVCLLLAGAFTELGLFGLARVWGTAFADVLPAGDVRPVLVAFGVVTAVTGAAMALAQRHLRRMLAFLTIGTVGGYLAGFATLRPEGLAGAWLWIVADGCGKASLFVCVGMLQDRFGSVDAADLHGRGRDMPIAGAVTLVAGLCVAGTPLLGPFWGKALAEHPDELLAGYGWVPWVLTVAVALGAGAVLRMAGGVFAGIGAPPERDPSTDDAEDDAGPGDEDGRGSPVLGVLAVLLVAGSAGLHLITGLDRAVLGAAQQLVDPAAHRAIVLGGARRAAGAATVPPPSTLTWLLGAAGTLGALLIAWLALRPAATRRRAVPMVLVAAGQRLRALHSGHVGDYALWLCAGVVALGAPLLLLAT